MNVKDLLLNAKGFLALLQEFSINAEDVEIKDEAVLFSNASPLDNIIKESVLIVGKGKEKVVSFFGILHCNLRDSLAVFEVSDIEQKSIG